MITFAYLKTTTMNIATVEKVDIDSVRDMALVLMDTTFRYNGVDYNMNDLGWKFQFHDKKKSFGTCKSTQKTICLSRYLVETTIREMSGWNNTMIHEIAHAINHTLGGQGHDWRWRNIFLGMGGSGERCSKDEVTYENITSKYTISCPNGHVQPSYKRARAVEEGRRACGKCCDEFNGGDFSKDYILTQTKNY